MSGTHKNICENLSHLRMSSGSPRRPPGGTGYGAPNASFIAFNKMGSTPGATLDAFGPVS